MAIGRAKEILFNDMGDFFRQSLNRIQPIHKTSLSWEAPVWHDFAGGRSINAKLAEFAVLPCCPPGKIKGRNVMVTMRRIRLHAHLLIGLQRLIANILVAQQLCGLQIDAVTLGEIDDRTVIEIDPLRHEPVLKR